MERFLSPAWFDRFAHREGPGDRSEVILQQVVTGTPDGEIRYQVSIGGERATIHVGSPAEADMTFTSDYNTAAAIAAGALSTDAALASGRLRVAGNLARVEGRAAAMHQLDSLGVDGRLETTFDAGEGVG